MTEQGKLLEKWTRNFEKLLNCDDLAEEFPKLNIIINGSAWQTGTFH